MLTGTRKWKKKNVSAIRELLSSSPAGQNFLRASIQRRAISKSVLVPFNNIYLLLPFGLLTLLLAARVFLTSIDVKIMKVVHCAYRRRTWSRRGATVRTWNSSSTPSMCILAAFVSARRETWWNSAAAVMPICLDTVPVSRHSCCTN